MVMVKRIGGCQQASAFYEEQQRKAKNKVVIFFSLTLSDLIRNKTNSLLVYCFILFLLMKETGLKIRLPITNHVLSYEQEQEF